MFCRYKGKKAPDAIPVEICWWSRNVFEAQEEEKETSQPEDQSLYVDVMYASDESDFDDSEDDGTANGYQKLEQPQQQTKQATEMQGFGRGRGRGHGLKLPLPQVHQIQGRGRGSGQPLHR